MKVVAPIAIVTGSTLVSTNVTTAADPAAWNSGTTYALADRVTSNELIYESAQASNLNKPPASNPTWWFQVGSVNKMAMFDRRVGSQTSFADTISVVLSLGEILDTLMLMNLEANSVTVTQTDPIDGVIYTQTIDLTESVGDWWEYLYFPINRSNVALFTEFLPYRTATVTVLINNTGGTAKCGLLVAGVAVESGAAQLGASDELNDYSTIEEDAWGIRDIVERDYADQAEFTMTVETATAPYFRRLLVSRRALGTLFILAAERPDAAYFGLISFRRVIPFNEFDVFSLTVKGFT